jgi:4-amino-4-deoxy-L-arabinose transferase-like glycosyltransferase
MIKSPVLWRTRNWISVVGALALVERIMLYILYRPIPYNDTGSYRRLAESILAGWNSYDGTRTPGYPLFLALVGTDERVYAVQLALGFLTTLLLFYITWRISGRAWLAGLAALSHSLNPQQFFFEANLLTETLTTFLIMLSMALLTGVMYSKKPALWKTGGLAVVIGMVAGGAALTRPLFIFLPFWMAFFVLVFWNANNRIRWSFALLVGLSGVVLVGLWVNFMHQHFHMLSLTTMTGFHLVQHTGLYFEYVPDKYAVIRDVYLHFRAEQIASTGSPGNAIWDAIPELSKASGLGFLDLSRTLTKISVQLIIDHPGLYLKNVILGWFWFWKAPVYYHPVFLGFSWSGIILKWIIRGWQSALILFNIGFVSGSALLGFKRVRQCLRMDASLWLMVSIIWLTSIVQTLVDHGDNPRFLVPIQSLVVLIVLIWGMQIIKNLREKNENHPT